MTQSSQFQDLILPEPYIPRPGFSWSGCSRVTGSQRSVVIWPRTLYFQHSMFSGSWLICTLFSQDCMFSKVLRLLCSKHSSFLGFYVLSSQGSAFLKSLGLICPGTFGLRAILYVTKFLGSHDPGFSALCCVLSTFAASYSHITQKLIILEHHVHKVLCSQVPIIPEFPISRIPCFQCPLGTWSSTQCTLDPIIQPPYIPRV